MNRLLLRLLFWMQGELLREVLPTGYGYLPSIDARGERYETALQELIQALGRQTSFTAAQAPPPEPLPLPVLRNPYRGLQPFCMEDAQDFFGRERQVYTELSSNRHALLFHFPSKIDKTVCSGE